MSRVKSRGRMWVNAGLSERSELNDAEGLGDRKIKGKRLRKTEREVGNVMGSLQMKEGER